MSTTILIAPYEGPLAAAIAAEARGLGHRLVLARRAGAGAPRFAPAAGPVAEGLLAEGGAGFPGPSSEAGLPAAKAGGEELELSWNPASYVSVGALLLEARGGVGEIDLAVILGGSSPATEGGLLDAAPGALSARIEEDCLGPALLSRELARRFAARGAGRLLLVAPEAPAPAGGAHPGGAAEPLGAIAAGAFRGLGEGLFALSKEAAWSCFGLLEGSGQPEPAARFALKLLDEGKSAKSGRWLRYTGKSGLFGVF